MSDASHGEVFGDRVRRIVVVIAMLSVVAMTAGLLFGEKLTEPAAGETDSYGKKELGHHALVALLERLGKHVIRMRDPRYGEVTTPVLFLEPRDEAVVDGQRFSLEEVVRERVDKGLPTCVVLPKWTMKGRRAVHDDARKAVIRALRAGGDDLDDAPTSAASAEGDIGSFALEMPEPSWLHADDPWEVVLASGDEAFVVRRGPLVVVSDPDVIHNFNIHRKDHALLIDALFSRVLVSDTLTIDEVFHGHGERLSLSKALSQFPAVLLPVHGMLLAFVLVFYGWTRFGAPLATDKVLRRGPVESMSVVAAVLARGRNVASLAAQYVDALMGDLADAYGIAPGPMMDRAVKLDALATDMGVLPRARELMQEREAVLSAPAALRPALAWSLRAWRFRGALLEKRRGDIV